MLSLKDINNLTNETNLSIEEVNSLFTILENPGKGNCLFYSFSQLFFDGSIKKHTQLRKEVCEFYKKFNLDIEYPEDSLEYQIKIQLLYVDPEHKKKVCKNLDWGIMPDIIAISILYQVNIFIFNLFRENNFYQVTPIKSTENRRNIYLRYNTENEDEEHYEAMIPKINEVINSNVSLNIVRENITKPLSTPITVSKPVTNHLMDDLIGQTVAKNFDEGEFIGTVQSYNHPYYNVVYEDGDTEELTKKQLEKILLKGGNRKHKKSKRKSSKKSKRKSSKKSKRKSSKKA